MIARCSATPRILACPSSLLPPKTKHVDAGSPIASLGTFIHRMLAQVVQGGDLPVDLSGQIRQLGFDARDVAILLAVGRRAWDALSEHFPEAMAEVSVRSDICRGTADVLHHDGETAAVLDWKTNYVERDYSAQVTAYAYCLRAMEGMPSSGTIMAAPVFLRIDTMDVLQLTDEHLDTFAERLRRAFDSAGDEYGPGEACTFCPRSHECNPRLEWLSSQAAFLTTTDAALVKPEEVAALYPAVQAIEKAIADFKAAARSIVQTHGPQRVDDGRELRLLERHEVSIDPHVLREVMVRQYGWTKEDLYNVLRVNKTALVEAVRRAAGRGQKKAEEESLMRRLENADGVNTRIQQQLRVVKI